MEDRLRFRAWNKEKKIMHYEAEKGLPDILPFAYMCKSDEFIVEQCTGLKDKNGRLIYEGDIVFYGGVDLWWVVFEEKYCSFELLRKDGKGVSMFGHKEMVVVGNIHENPKLLEELK